MSELTLLGALKPIDNRAILTGHSMLDQHISDTPSGNNTRVSQQWLWAFPAFLGAISKGRVVCTEDAKFAFSGTLVQDIGETVLTLVMKPNGQGVGKTQLQAAIDHPARLVFYWTGHNDWFNGGTYTNVIAKATRDITALTNAGKLVVVLSEIPTGSASYTNRRLSGQLLDWHTRWVAWQVNEVKKLWPGRAIGVDLWGVMVDQTSTTSGDVISSKTQDGVHTSTPGAYPQARKVLAALDTLGIPHATAPVHRPGERYSVDNPLGNLLGDAGSLTLGSTAWSGSFTTGMTLAGLRPTVGSQFGSAGSGVSLTLTGSFVDTPTGRWWQVRVQGTSSGATANPSFSIAPMSTSALLTAVQALGPGKTFRQFGEFEVDKSGVGLCGISAILQRNLPLVGGVAKYDLTAQMFGNESSGVWDTFLANEMIEGQFAGVNSITTDGNELGIFSGLQIVMKGNTAIDFTFRVRNLAVRNMDLTQ